MRSRLSKEVRKQFDLRLRRTYPAFAPVDKSAWSFVYFLSISAGLGCYAKLQISNKRDAFTVEIGYGAPGVAPRGNLARNYDEALVQPGSYRLGMILNRPGGDLWWLVDPYDWTTDPDPVLKDPTPEDLCLPRIPSLLDDVFTKLASHAVPYWREVARRHGHEMELFPKE